MAFECISANKFHSYQQDLLYVKYRFYVNSIFRLSSLLFGYHFVVFYDIIRTVHSVRCYSLLPLLIGHRILPFEVVTCFVIFIAATKFQRKHSNKM